MATQPDSMPIGGDFDMRIELPLPVADYKNIAVWLIDSKCNAIGKYALYTLPEHNSDDVSDPAASELLIKVQKSVTSLAKEGVATIEVYEAITDVDREGFQFAEIADAVLCTFTKNKISSIAP